MTNRERILAILNGKTPDRVPFIPFAELIPRGQFEREMRSRGMGLMPSAVSSLWPEMPDVSTSQRSVNGELVVTYHTPAGDVSVTRRTHAGRLSNDSSVQEEFLIKDVKDYEPVIFMIDDTNYHVDSDSYNYNDWVLGDDGIVHSWTDEPPYMDAQYFLGLEKWSYEQYDHPDEFSRLLDALERRQERRFKLLLDCPDLFINLGNLAGNFGPNQFEKYMLPYFKKYALLFKEQGKICTIHADALNLSEFKELIVETEIDVIEAFTPPPVGNLSLADARKAWGEGKTIWINFPETIFYEGYEKTKQYTVDLLRSDPCPNKFIGPTEMGFVGVNENNFKLFQDGFRAVMDAIEEAGVY